MQHLHYEAELTDLKICGNRTPQPRSIAFNMFIDTRFREMGNEFKLNWSFPNTNTITYMRSQAAEAN